MRNNHLSWVDLVQNHMGYARLFQTSCMDVPELNSTPLTNPPRARYLNYGRKKEWRHFNHFSTFSASLSLILSFQWGILQRGGLANTLLSISVTYVSERDLKGCVAFSLHYGNPERFGLLAFFFPLSMKHITVLPGKAFYGIMCLCFIIKWQNQYAFKRP